MNKFNRHIQDFTLNLLYSCEFLSCVLLIIVQSFVWCAWKTVLDFYIRILLLLRSIFKECALCVVKWKCVVTGFKLPGCDLCHCCLVATKYAAAAASDSTKDEWTGAEIALRSCYSLMVVFFKFIFLLMFL